MKLTALSSQVPVLTTVLSYGKVVGEDGNGKATVLQPKLLIQLYNNKIVEAKGKVGNNALWLFS